MTPVILTVPHIPQRYAGECLAACAAMLLVHFDIPMTYQKLLNMLRIKRGLGTPSSNIRVLNKLGLMVIYESGTFPKLHEHLSNNRPCIAFVEAGEFPYWNERNSHAIVVVGLDTQFVYINDPALAYGSIRIPHGDFDLAWLEHENFYATFVR